MRAALLVFAGGLLLTACDSGGVPSPAEKRDGRTIQAPIASGAVELRGEGLAAGAEAFFFAAGQAEVETALAKALGEPLRRGENRECGAGAITFTDFAGGLTAHFQQGKLVGWNWHLPQDGDKAASGTISLAGTVELGAPRAVVEAAPGFIKVEDSTLGEEFALGPKIGGIVEGDAVEMLYAGTQCFFR